MLRLIATFRLKGLMGPTVWQEFTPLAVQHQAYNLGQGFPDWACPAFCKDAAKTAIDANHNQYARSAGHPALVNVLADQYSKFLGRTVYPLTEVTGVLTRLHTAINHRAYDILRFKVCICCDMTVVSHHLLSSLDCTII